MCAVVGQDQGQSWGEGWGLPASIADPNCEGSLASDPKTGTLYFAHPTATSRRNLTVFRSEDGKDWTLHGVAFAGPAEYSDVTVLPDGRVAVLFDHSEPWEHSTADAAQGGGTALAVLPAAKSDDDGGPSAAGAFTVAVTIGPAHATTRVTSLTSVTMDVCVAKQRFPFDDKDLLALTKHLGGGDSILRIGGSDQNVFFYNVSSSESQPYSAKTGGKCCEVRFNLILI